MKAKKIFTTILFLSPIFLFAQKEDDYIEWQNNRKLEWEDFKANPVRMGSTAAMTTTHLGFSYHIANGNVTYEIECRFQKSKSWGLVKNDWILGHEQGHFDIAEIFARKLKKAVSEYEFNFSSFKKDLDAIYKNVVHEKERYQQLYDDETDYSRNKTRQEEWLKKITSQLEEFKGWAMY